MPRSEGYHWTEDPEILEEDWDLEYSQQYGNYSDDAIYIDYALWQQWYGGQS